MKKLCILLFATATMVVGCDDKKKDLQAQFNTLNKENDSIEANHLEFEEAHKQMLAEHQKFSEELKTVTVKDSTVLEDMAKHEVILKSHDAILKSHTELMKGHKQLKSDFEGFSDIEMQAQIDQMKDDHDKMMEEHTTMQDEHTLIMNEHQNIEKRLAEEMALEDSAK